MYIRKVLEQFQMQGYKPIDPLIGKGDALSFDICPRTQEEKEKMARVSYSTAIGSLIYAMMYTRPDICSIVRLASWF